ncbi:MAG: hypothetical protein ASARMPREDX12_008580 [Alectoria sarmentosa]|nr:MAG: hypothetical protein ASARMPREDX12_008580 [Alectoria sarmentosa]
MKLLDLSAEVVLEALKQTVVAAGFGRAFRLRRVCKIFDAEVLRAIFTTRVIQDYPRGIEPHSGAEVIISRHLESGSLNRSSADFQNCNKFTAALRRAAETLAFEDCIYNQHTWGKTIRALSQAATIHCCPEMVLRLLKSKHDGGNSARNEDEIVKSVLNVESERDVFVGAAYTGNIVTVREMLTSSRHAQRESKFFGHHPLQCACSGGRKDIVVQLLEHGADISHGKTSLRDAPVEFRPWYFGSSLLQSACLAGHEDIVRLLLEPKYEIRMFHSEFRIAILQAARGGHLNILMLLLEEARPGTIRRKFLLSEASKCAETNGWPNILMPAASKGQAHIVTFLLESQADPNVEGGSAKAVDALKLAKHFGYESVVRTFINHGVRKDETSDGTSPQ